MKFYIKTLSLSLLITGLSSSSVAQVYPGNNNNIGGPGTASAIGDDNTSDGDYSFAFGFKNNVYDDHSFAFGLQNNVFKAYSFAFGYRNKISNIYSFAFGQQNQTDGRNSFAFGFENQISSDNSFAFGNNVSSSQDGAFTIGKGISTSVKLDNNMTNSLMIGFNSNVPTFFVGPSNGTAGSTGNVGIGTSSPDEKLEVDGNIKIGKNDIYLKDKNHGLGWYGSGKLFAGFVIDGPVLYGWNGGALGVEKNGVQINALNWNKDGNVGVGTNSPTAKLDVNGRINIMSESLSFGNINHGIIRGGSNIYGNDVTLYTGAGSLNFATTQSPYGYPSLNDIRMRIFNDGNVGIGTDNTQGHKLAVKGSLIAEEIFVKLYASWPDYVFGEKYDMKSLPEVEEFIKKNNHLPNVPSEGEVEEEGINLGEMDAILLRKIEELTLYTIQQQKLIEKQGELIEQLIKK